MKKRNPLSYIFKSIATVLFAVMAAFALTSTANAAGYTVNIVEGNMTETPFTNLFEGSGVTMPGDVYSSSFDVKNRTNHAIDAYLSIIDCDDVSHYNGSRKPTRTNDFIAKLQLKITDERGNVIYSGSAAGSNSENDITLGKFDVNQTKSYSFTLSIPAELGNNYAMSYDVVDWVFFGKYPDEDETNANTNTNDNNNSNANENANENSGENTSENNNDGTEQNHPIANTNNSSNNSEYVEGTSNDDSSQVGGIFKPISETFDKLGILAIPIVVSCFCAIAIIIVLLIKRRKRGK